MSQSKFHFIFLEWNTTQGLFKFGPQTSKRACCVTRQPNSTSLIDTSLQTNNFQEKRPTTTSLFRMERPNDPWYPTSWQYLPLPMTNVALVEITMDSIYCNQENALQTKKDSKLDCCQFNYRILEELMTMNKCTNKTWYG